MLTSNSSEAESPSHSEKEDLKRKRQYVIQEIQSTEELYIKRLKSTLDVYVAPLKAAKIIDPLDLQKQFFVLENIYDLHSQYLDVDNGEASLDYLRLLEAVCSNSSLYAQYLVDYESSMQQRGHLLTSNRKFADFVDKAMGDPRIGGQGLEALLILPVQRIPRYRLLLEQLLKFTPSDHEQHKQVSAALGRICEVNRDNNEAIRARENRQKIMEVMLSMEPRSRVDLLSDDQRRFVKEGALFRQCRRAPKEFQFWLFTDKLLYGQRLPLGDFTLHREISLSQCFVRSMDSDQGHGHGHGQAEGRGSDPAAWFPFTVESPAKSFVVLCSKESDRADWLEAICSAIAQQHARLSREMGSVAPIWTPDSTSQCCLLCDRPFTLFQRRHHCRACGKVLCDACSHWRCMLRQVDARRPVRVCQLCFENLSSDEAAAATATTAALDGSATPSPSPSAAGGSGSGSGSGTRLGLLHGSRPSLLQTARSLRSLSLFAFAPSSKGRPAEEQGGGGGGDHDHEEDDDGTARRSSDSEISVEGEAEEEEQEKDRRNPILHREGDDQVRVEVREEDLDDFNDFMDDQLGTGRTGRGGTAQPRPRLGLHPSSPYLLPSSASSPLDEVRSTHGSPTGGPPALCAPPKPPKSGKTMLPTHS